MNDSCHVVIIGANLKCFTSLHLQCDVKSVNVHCNNISEIKGLEKFEKLKTLDISSNSLSSMSGLSKLSSLTHLNLASNFITIVTGIGNLNHLSYVNLSYNKIRSLQGFVELHGISSQLKVIELHGNDISSSGHVVSCLQGIVSLQHLILKRDTHGNPVVDTLDYREVLLNKLPQLISLDHLNRSDEIVGVDGGSDLNGMSTLDWESSCLSDSGDHEVTQDVNSSLAQKLLKINTPHIDAVLSARKSSPGEVPSPDAHSNIGASMPSSPNPDQGLITTDVPSLSKTPSDDYCDAASPNPALNKVHAALTRTDDKVKDSQRRTYTAVKCKIVPLNKLAKRKARPVGKKKTSSTASSNLAASCPSPKSADFIDKHTFLNLLKELESERERRWKSEQASRKLVAVVREMQAQQNEAKSLQQVAADTAERLKQALLSEKDNNESLKQENQDHVEKLRDLNEKFALFSKEKQVTVHHLQTSLSNANAKVAKLQSSNFKEKQELEAKASNASACQETERLKNEQLKMKLDGLQSLLVCRESEYRKSLSSMYSMANEDFRNAVTREIEKNETRHQEELFKLKDKVSAAQTDFSNLECEFREALYIESERYNVIEEQCNAATADARKYEALLNAATEKEEKCRSMLLEMTGIVKEQKTKISEISKCKEEMTKQFQSQLNSLQEETEKNRKKVLQLELTKHEKTQLVSKLSALQSVVDGLKEERKLWGLELAQQGSSLSQDRGRLEMKIESLKAEVTSLKKGNERDLDCLRIKTKVVEDQTETISRMKEALASKDKEIRCRLEDNLVEQRRCEETIEDLTRENVSLQEENLKLNERKQQLKNELANLSQEHEALLDGHQKQKKRWLEKASLLSKLEVQLKSLGEAGKQRELKLLEEKEDAVKSLQLAKDKTNQLVAAYQEQLRMANEAHERELECLQRDKREEIRRMENKVASVESEMSELLKESEERKKFVDVKVERLKFMLNEFI